MGNLHAPAFVFLIKSSKHFLAECRKHPAACDTASFRTPGLKEDRQVPPGQIRPSGSVLDRCPPHAPSQRGSRTPATHRRNLQICFPIENELHKMVAIYRVSYCRSTMD